VLQAGATTLHLYSVLGVINTGNVVQTRLFTGFACTNTSTSPLFVSVEVFPIGGGGPVNDATTTVVSLAAGASVVFTTQPNGWGTQTLLAPPLPEIATGSARILSTSKHLACSAFVADAAGTQPQSQRSLTIIAKLKQKAAN
jgi:hypothetical protein